MIYRFLVFCLFLIVTSAHADEKIQVIWQIGENFWEVDWIKEVLSEVDYDEIRDGQYNIVRDRSIVIVSKPNPLSEKYFKQLRQKKYKFGIIHLSDEKYNHDTSFYRKAKFILRNLWYKEYAANPRVFCFPLGYKKGFWNNCEKNIPKASQRKYNWSFAGQIIKKQSRADMIQQMQTIPTYFVHETFRWNDKKSLSTADYRQMLLDSIFSPCPKGWWNLDSFRVYESLECGCIPIVQKQPLDYFTKFLGKHPFISIDSWDEAPAQIEKLLADPIALEHRRQQCEDWWKAYKVAMKKKVATIVHKSLR